MGYFSATSSFSPIFPSIMKKFTTFRTKLIEQRVYYYCVYMRERENWLIFCRQDLMDMFFRDSYCILSTKCSEIFASRSFSNKKKKILIVVKI